MNKIRQWIIDSVICCTFVSFAINIWWNVVFGIVDRQTKICLTILVASFSICFIMICFKDLIKADNKSLSEITKDEFKVILGKSIKETKILKDKTDIVAATKHFVSESAEELKKEINKALKDNASDTLKIKLIDNLVQKNDKCPILFTNGTFMSCLKAILELDKTKDK